MIACAPGAGSTPTEAASNTARVADRPVHRAFTRGSRSCNRRPPAGGRISRHMGQVEDVVRVGRLEIRPSQHTVLLDDTPLVLTVREAALLAELARHPD